jgi:quinoprotein dehydrogenase-associated SoxYZ-like carrier
MIRHLAWIFAIGMVLHAPLPVIAATPDPEEAWRALADDIFKGRPLADGAGLVGLEMPARADDAAIVPVTMRVTLPAGDTRHLKTLTLVVDNNPAPVAATFSIGPNAGISTISTRVRVDSYTHVHAIAELSDDRLYVVNTYVKASGGCAAPAAKVADAAAERIGQMKFRQFATAGEGPASAPREAQVMMRHEQFRLAARPGHAALHSGVLRRRAARVAGRCAAVLDGRRHLDLGRPELPLQLRSQWRRDVPRRSQGHRRQAVPAGVAGDRDVTPDRFQKQRTSASACARRRSFSALLACSVVRNWEPRSPMVCAMLSTVSAVT